MNRICEMTFREFVDAAQASAGMNRWPQVGTAQDVVSYSVFISGEIASMLPASALEHEYRDVMLHPLTEKLGLDPLSMRDNLKVAELVALRHSYMTAVLEGSMLFTLSETVSRDYEALSNQMTHPIIQEAIEKQKQISKLLIPVLADAERVLGQQTHERHAAGIVCGEIITATENFTVQSVGSGEIVVHENDRLLSRPTIGKEVTVVYYRGKGQILDSVKDHEISAPYIDSESGDLAVNLLDGQNNIKHVVKFLGIVLVAQFAEAHGLDKAFIERAMDARQSVPEAGLVREQTVEGEPYIDKDTGSIAFDFREGAIKYTAIFRTADDLAERARTLGANPYFTDKAYQIESLQGDTVDLHAEKKSFEQAASFARIHVGREGSVTRANTVNGRYAGKVMETTRFHVVQDMGRNEVVIHDVRSLGKVVLPGERMSVTYSNGHADIKMRQISQSRSNSR